MKKSLFVILLLPVLAWAAQSPFDGTWKIDLSTAQLPDKPIVTVLQNGTYQNSTSVPKINIKADGTDQPVPGAKGYDTLAVKIVDDRTVQFTAKKAGKVLSSDTNTVSADGKTITYEFTEYPLASKQPVTGKYMASRIATGPSGSHAISGTWRTQKADVSANALTATLKTTADSLMYSSPIGESFDAKFDGKDYPMKGGAAGITVSLMKVNDRSIIYTVKRNGEIVEVNHLMVSADGKTCTIKSENKVQGTTSTYTSYKQ